MIDGEYFGEFKHPQASLADDEPVLDLGIEDNIILVRELREDLWRRGYRPIAVYGPDSGVEKAGKRPKGLDWLDRARRDPPDAVQVEPEASALNTGILCDGLIAIDIDVDDPVVAVKVRTIIVDMLGNAPCRTRSNSPRSLFLFRASVGEPESTRIQSSNGLVELLGRNKQFVAYGTHPTGAALEWENVGPADIDRDELPAVTEEQITALLDALRGVLGVAGTVEAKPPATVHIASLLGQAADPLDIVAAVLAIPNNGPKDWEHWNRVGMATFAASAGSGSGYAAWLAWSEKHPDHDADACQERWKNYEKSPPESLGAGTLFYMAVKACPGWKKPTAASLPNAGTLPAFKIVSASELMTMPLPPRGTVIDPWLPEKGLAMVYGPRGVGKTYLVSGAAYAIATGGQFLGWNAHKPRRVLIIDGEMPAVALRDRLTTIIRRKRLELLRFLSLDLQERDLDLSDALHQDQLEPILAATDVIFVDNISTLTRGGRENEAESWLPVQEWALQQRRAGRSVVFVHHAGKGGQQRGTSRREDVLDTVISLRKPADYQPEQGARFELHYEKARGFHGQDAKPFEAVLENGQWLVRNLADVTFDRVVELSSSGASVREIAEELQISKSSAQRHVARARDMGKLPSADTREPAE
jgi:hypothetical protein